MVAIVLEEPEGPLFERVLSEADEAYATPVNLMEAGLAIVLRQGHFTPEQFSEWVKLQRIVQRHVDASAALDAYLAYGKGVHRASLNLGDCFAYALAKQLEAPLLYKGDDFKFTDVRSALQPT
jgi:ribonuclease VapC